jgi:inositol oxygenase
MRVKENAETCGRDAVTGQEVQQGEKPNYRHYADDPKTELEKRVRRTYYNMHEKQTVEFVRQQREKWCKFDLAELDILQAVDLLDDFVDEADPDTDFPNSFHAFQTAEMIRADHPDEDWFQLTGLIHDVGKVMAKYGQEQWCTVGDTYPVGLAPRPSIVFGEESFRDCPDMKDERYNTRLGMYTEGCGLDNVVMSWGHDEYLYQVLKNHPTCTLPEPGLWCIRYHSFYPWHNDGDYMDLCNDEDKETLEWVRKFNKYDLYSKCDDLPDLEKLKPYYQSLVDKYIPGKVKF